MNDNTLPPVDPPAELPDTPQSASPSPEKPNPPTVTPGKGGTLRIWISWILILAAVITTHLAQDEDSAPHQGFTRDAAMQLTGRYTVGVKKLFGNTDISDLSIPQLKNSLETAGNPQTRLYLVPILYEMSAQETALSELKSLAEGPANDPVARDAAIFLKLYQHGSDSLTAREYQAIEKYEWIGKLALSHDRPASDPLRREVVDAALQTFIIAIVFIIVVLFALVVGLALFILAVYLWKKGRLRSGFAAPLNPGTSLLEAFAIFMTGMILLPDLAHWLFPDNVIASAVFAVFTLPAVVIALLWPSIRGSNWHDIRTALGWHRGRGILREMGAGILGYLAGLPLMIAALIPVFILSQFTESMPSHPIVNEIDSNPFTLLFILGLACIWAPVIEETFFRGMLFGYLRRRWRLTISGIATGILFAVIHPQGWVAVPVLAAIGFIFCVIREWRGSIIASMTAHALNNGVILSIAVLMLT